MNNYSQDNENVQCLNCCDYGHIVRNCALPVSSYGILAYKTSTDKLDLSENVPEYFKDQQQYRVSKIKFCMVRRKHSMGYMDFLRGKYSNANQIKTFVDEMTTTEQDQLLTLPFEELWEDLWKHSNKRSIYRNDFSSAKERFSRVNIAAHIKHCKTRFEIPEYGIPKGRLEFHESFLETAKREFEEEAGYSSDEYTIVDTDPIIEEFTGTNGVKYRHTYFLAEMNEPVRPPAIDKTNTLQVGEISDIGWFTLGESERILRPYDVAKKEVLRAVHRRIYKSLR